MAKTKTKPTGASVDKYLESRANPEQLKDCRAIMAMCKRVTRKPPHMWRPSMVGFGSYTYTYDTGHSGDAPLAAFAIRGRELVVYLGVDDPGQAQLLSKLGKHKMGKSCLYFKRLADLDIKALEALIALSVAEVTGHRGHPLEARSRDKGSPCRDLSSLELLLNAMHHRHAQTASVFSSCEFRK